MSFTQSVAEELREIRWHKTCCKKAALCGLLFGAQRIEAEKAYVASFNSDVEAIRATELIDAGFFTGEKTEVIASANGGHRVYRVHFSSRSLTGVIFDLDNGRRRSIAEAVGFRCPECETAFLAGAFLAAGFLAGAFLALGASSASPFSAFSSAAFLAAASFASRSSTTRF